MKNVIQFRNGFVNLPAAGTNNAPLAMSITSELMQFGYILNSAAIANLTNASKPDLIKFHNEIISFLKKMTGSSRTYVPFWKGFPEEVMEKTEQELWIYQILHYISNGHFEPSDWSKQKPTAFENSKYTTITAGDDQLYRSIFTTLVSVNSSLTPEDLETVKYFVSSGERLVFPSSIPFKENLCTLAAMGLNVPVKTVTDVLRIAVHLSGGDISLPAVPQAKIALNRWSHIKSDNPARAAFKFKKFTRPERKYLLGLLETTNCDIREFVLKDQRWIRLGEILHPGEYRVKFPKAYYMFNDIRNTKVQSWYGEVESAFKLSYQKGLDKLAERPGEFMRRFDSLIRNCNKPKDKAILFDALLVAASGASNKVLFEALKHFEERTKTVIGRSIMIKGARKRTALPDLLPLEPSDIRQIKKTIKLALKAKFAKLGKLGNVWIDEELQKIPIPTNMRSLNAALKPTIRGQRVPIGNKDSKVIRAFVHWFDEHGKEDLDLTATLIGLGKSLVIGWNGSHSHNIGCYSGDVRHRRGACAEYIDLDFKKALNYGFKYAVIDVRNYNGGTLESISECVFGYMEREFPEANLHFVPSTLANSVRLSSKSSTTIVAIIDFETREYIFLDIDQDGIPVASANYEAILKAIKPYTEKPAFSFFDLLELHADSRGTLVDNKEEADVKLTVDEFASSYIEILKWMGV